MKKFIGKFRGFSIYSDPLVPPGEIHFVNEQVKNVSDDLAYQIDTYMRMSLKPRSRWLPDPIHKWLIKKLFVLEYKI